MVNIKMQIYRKYFRACSLFMAGSFISGVIWSICAITVIRDKAHIVAGVGLIGFSAIGSVSSFLTYLLWDANTRETNIVTINVCKSTKIQERSLVALVYEGDIIQLAISTNTPPKIVVFETEE